MCFESADAIKHILISDASSDVRNR
jgi:hypothetical protein